MNYTTIPITNWPQLLTQDRKSGWGFKATIGATMRLLDSELQKIGATDIIIEMDLRPKDIRNDGKPREDAMVQTPRIALSFNIGKERYVYRCDTYENWKANMRAIALTLEALRAVDRYGAVRKGQQYAGFKALPSGIPMGPPAMTVEEAAKFVVHESNVGIAAASVVKSLENFYQAYRSAAKLLHPDAGGNRQLWDRLHEAAAVLKKHHGVA